jgi:thioredoxin 1
MRKLWQHKRYPDSIYPERARLGDGLGQGPLAALSRVHEEMSMRKFLSIISILAILLVFLKKPANASEVVPGIPVKNTVTLVDLGATTCIPCKMMAPILEELKAEYKGRVKVIFINVWDQANTEKTKAFKILAIPTQIFYDRTGKEVYRHTGFLDKKSITAKLEEILNRK